MFRSMFKRFPVVGDDVFLKLLGNFEVFSLRENRVSFDEFDVSDDGISAPVDGCEVSRCRRRCFPEIIRKSQIFTFLNKFVKSILMVKDYTKIS